MISIGFIGNCQTVSLCYFLQELLQGNTNYKIQWCCYEDDFKEIIEKERWADKCKNKIYNKTESMRFLEGCDYIIYQHISEDTSPFFNTKCLEYYAKDTCKLISMPCIYLKYDSYDTSILELKKREKTQNVTITVSNLFTKENYKNLLLTYNHPTTFLFLELLKQICKIMNIEFFNKEQIDNYLKDKNHMGLAEE